MGMSALNHRGEQAHGIAFVDSNGQLEIRKSRGLVRDSPIFDEEIRGGPLIGHTRYPTSSRDTMENAQPIRVYVGERTVGAMAHNGNIKNDEELKLELLKDGALDGALRDELEREGVSDTRVLGALLALTLQNGNEAASVREALKRSVGSYSMVFLVAGQDPKVIAIRDPLGYMPLQVGSNGDGFFVASESVAFGRNYLNASFRDVKPGEMLMIDREGIKSVQLFESNQTQHCMFQYVYMCRPESRIEGGNIYTIRENLGAEIAGHYRPRVDFVAPIMDSGFVVASGYSRATGVPICGAVVKDRYESRRSFMQNDQNSRDMVVGKKLNVIADLVKGKSVLLMDDSLVRGTTMRKVVKEMRESGAKEVHLAVSCPPIVSQCGDGIDFYNDSLIARPFREMKPEELNRTIAKLVGVDTFYYQTIDDLARAIGLKREQLCLSCLTGIYAQPFKLKSEAERRESSPC